VDRAETLRAALRKQEYARRAFQQAKTREVPPDQSPEQWSEQLETLRRAADEAEAEMTRLRPEPRDPADASEDAYQPPIPPALSN
jgi:hypothetical protein